MAGAVLHIVAERETFDLLDHYYGARNWKESSPFVWREMELYGRDYRFQDPELASRIYQTFHEILQDLFDQDPCAGYAKLEWAESRDGATMTRVREPKVWDHPGRPESCFEDDGGGGGGDDGPSIAPRPPGGPAQRLRQHDFTLSASRRARLRSRLADPNQTAEDLKRGFDALTNAFGHATQQKNLEYAQRILAGERPEDVMQGLRVNGAMWQAVMAKVAELKGQERSTTVSPPPQLSVSGMEQKFGLRPGSLDVRMGRGEQVYVRNRLTGRYLSTQPSQASIEQAVKSLFSLV